jgi:hypothetical protein
METWHTIRRGANATATFFRNMRTLCSTRPLKTEHLSCRRRGRARAARRSWTQFKPAERDGQFAAAHEFRPLIHSKMGDNVINSADCARAATLACWRRSFADARKCHNLKRISDAPLFDRLRNACCGAEPVIPTPFGATDFESEDAFFFSADRVRLYAIEVSAHCIRYGQKICRRSSNSDPGCHRTAVEFT